MQNQRINDKIGFKRSEKKIMDSQEVVCFEYLCDLWVRANIKMLLLLISNGVERIYFMIIFQSWLLLLRSVFSKGSPKSKLIYNLDLDLRGRLSVGYSIITRYRIYD